jgi:hypothetical protein
MEDFLTEREAAQLLDLTVAALSYRRRHGNLRPARTRRPILYRTEDILKLKAGRKAAREAS